MVFNGFGAVALKLVGLYAAVGKSSRANPAAGATMASSYALGLTRIVGAEQKIRASRGRLERATRCVLDPLVSFPAQI